MLFLEVVMVIITFFTVSVIINEMFLLVLIKIAVCFIKGATADSVWARIAMIAFPIIVAIIIMITFGF
jgi:hypothetical protein